MSRASIRPPVSALVFAASLLVAAAPAGADCVPIRGAMQAAQSTAADCLSPEGLCTVGRIEALPPGGLVGKVRFSASAVLPSFDTPSTGVVFVTGDTVVEAVFGSLRGTLGIKNAAAFHGAGNGDLTDTQVIVAGTGDFAGAAGALRVAGTFVGGQISSVYEGDLCLPTLVAPVRARPGGASR
jgi:hypothetical protein